MVPIYFLKNNYWVAVMYSVGPASNTRSLTCKIQSMLKVPSWGHPTSRVGHPELQRVCHFFLFTSTNRLLARSLTSFQCPRVKLRGVVSRCPMLGGRGKQKYTKRLTKQTHETQTRSRAAQNRRQTESNNSDGSGDWKYRAPGRKTVCSSPATQVTPGASSRVEIRKPVDPSVRFTNSY